MHEGAVEFEFEVDDAAEAPPVRVGAAGHQAIPPGARHLLVLVGAVRLEVEFWTREAATPMTPCACAGPTALVTADS